ncbi:MAG TPA: methylmalonyl Co-A mutase-associated GTPase MeaB [Polyangia bacterium]
MDRPGLIRAGDQRALAALLRELEEGRAEASAELRALGAGAAPPFVVGITGPAGAGKSTLVDGLVERLRARGERVGIVAVDPSSGARRTTGGAVLGDRVRMQRHATDPGVFIRSLATRGARGGLSAGAADVIAALGAAGYGTVLVETVGVGQAETDVADAADVVVLVLVPGLGDDVQALKAGLLEIADVLVVNKADRADADRAAGDLAAMLDIRRAAGAGPPRDGNAGRADVPILRTVATTGAGLDELLRVIDLSRGPVAPARRRARAAARIQQAALARVAADVSAALEPGGLGGSLVDDVVEGRTDPAAAAEALMARLGRGY